MNRIAVFLCISLAPSVWADTVYFDTGNVWQNVTVLDTKQTATSAALLIQPTTTTLPRDVRGAWYCGAVHIELGDKPASPVLTYKSRHAPITDTVKNPANAMTLDLWRHGRILLLGVDAPILPEQFCGKEATTFMQRVATDQSVWIEFDGERNTKVGQLQGYVYAFPARSFLNEAMIASGFARVDTRTPLRSDYQGRFQQAESLARSHMVGLWNQLAAQQFVGKRNNPDFSYSQRTGSWNRSEVPIPSDGAEISAPSGGPKDVYVHGYTRKDGKYVAPYYRSRPRR